MRPRKILALLVMILYSFLAANTSLAADAPTTAPAKNAAPSAKDVRDAEKEKPKLTPAEMAAIKEQQIKEVNRQIHMIYIKGGCFDMGDFNGQGDEDELPVHEVCVSDFYLADAEVTQGLWFAVMGYYFTTPYEPEKPVVDVSMLFVNKFLSRINLLLKKYYRLPNEAEWEYAAREGGAKIRWSGTDKENEIADYAWFEDNSDNAIHNVRLKKPNKFGLYDMTGNAWEWVDDYFDFDYYKTSPRKQPLGPAFSLWRTIRGGSFMDDSIRARNTYRYALEPDQARLNVGFRIAE